MFAPRVAKVQAKTPVNSNHRSPHIPLAIRPASGQDSNPSSLIARIAAPRASRDFSAIPIFPPDRATQTEPPASRRAPPLPSGLRILQPKLAVGKLDDPLEREADRVADQVMRMPAPRLTEASASPQISRLRVGAPQKAKAERIETSPGEAPASVREALSSLGQPLDAATRAYFEPRFGHDFSRVRVHTGVTAERSAKEVNAQAYAAGQHIVFGAGSFVPTGHDGRRLIAHELAHVVQQQTAADHQIQRQPKEAGLSVHIMIGDSTRLSKDYTWHFDTIRKDLKDQLVMQIREAFSFLPKEFPLTVEWGQFKAADLKNAGNIQVWLIPEQDPDLARPIMQLYGYSKEPIEEAIKEFGNVKEHTFDDDTKREAVGITPVDAADPAHDPLTGRPVIVRVPAEFSEERDPAPEFRKDHPEATLSRRIAELGDSTLHEIGHLLGLGHATGNIGAVDPKTKEHEQSFPPDIMDRVAPVLLREYSDAKNIILTKAEVDALGGKETISQSPIVNKIEIDPKTGTANVWIKVEKLTYTKDERGAILQNLKNLTLFVESVNAAKQKVNK